VPKILLLTAENLPHEDLETTAVADSLTDLGVQSEIVVWTEPPLGPADLVVIRTTWGYTTRLEEFLSVLGGLDAVLTNPLEVVRWNCHKGYLAQLADSGVPVLPTVVVPASDERRGPHLPDFGTPEVIVKPAVSAGGFGIGRFPSRSVAAGAHLAEILTTGDALVQPFEPEIRSGERSLIHLGGAFSHAVRKTPADGDFRVQARYGGFIAPHSPSPAERVVADAALASVPGGPAALSYARVDLVGTPDRPVVMELELIEPELFLTRAPGSADRFARVLAALL
jgi:glutathione synthase/RimK-type ligase-like ATP-grasp enzyme